ncbi:DUF4139 domain-containing protein [Psychrobacter pygoscelis]|uniref:DUF4139 domain-containing protein n=1 Tax=Psychrobacter pygoscelis TaxID=2488563 RepID=UPI00103ACD32|nr:DUF4139 domain-containing protein [Psychrobacter pygoscelis]
MTHRLSTSASPTPLLPKIFLLTLSYSFKPVTAWSLLSSALLACVSAQAAVSNIDQVTIYQGLASVTRSLPINMSNSSAVGEQVLVFSCLSPNIDADSISVQAPRGVNIGEVSIETLSDEQASQCQYQNDAKVRVQQESLTEIEAELDAAKLAKSYLQNLTKAAQIHVNGSVSENVNDLEAQAGAVNKRIIELQRKQATAQDALSHVMAGGTGFVQQRVTQVSVRVASRNASSVKLHYQVHGASWAPTYQARLDTASKQLSITASAVIAQHTGENWINVPLVLSTVNPNQQTRSVVPYVSRLHLLDKESYRPEMAEPPMMASTPVVVVEPTTDYYEDAAGRVAGQSRQPLPSFSVDSNHKNGISEYHLSQRVSIPSDGRRVRTIIDEQSGKSELWLRSTPARDTKAYWYASAPFLTPDWVDGSLQLYRDDNYVGQALYSYQLLKDQGIGFGEDPNILVKQLSDDGKQGDSGIFNRNKTLTRKQTYQFTNTHNRSVELEVLGSEPLSLDDNIKISITHNPPVAQQDWHDNKGVVAWRFDLQPNQSKVVQSTYQFSYPASKELSEH